jgi:DNA polymerase III delta prime subunit
VNRHRLLAKVRTFWITDVLEQSLHGAALIALGLHEQPDAVANPWHLGIASPGEPTHALPPGTSIAQVYDEAVGELLLLGEPGSGKTTLLLELARTLLDRAQGDERHPLPVVFHLSSWASKQQPLDVWLIEELNTKYQVPRKLGKAWVAADQLLPLLDGLDEVAPSARSAYVEAINVYRLTHGLVPMVVCSRSAEYLAERRHVLLRKAVVVQPLTEQQIDAYLSRAGQLLEPVRAALRADGALQEVATTPLMLSVLALAYQGTAAEDLLVAAPAELRRRHIFEHYVERMLSRRGTQTPYQSQRTKGWLAWLARQMKQQSQTVFYIERMQPDWLPESWLHRPYRAVVRLGMAIASGLIMYLMLGIAIGLFVATGPGSRSGFLSGILGGFVSAVAGGLVIALTSRIETEIQPAEVVVWSWPRLVQVRASKRKLLVGSSSGLLLGLLLGLWAIVGSGASAAVLFLVVLAIAFIVVAIIALAGGLTSGVASTLQNERDLTRPNQGMKRSVRNSLRIGIMGAFVGGSISMVAFALVLLLLGTVFPAGLVNQLCFLLLCGSLGGTISGLMGGLPNGGIASMQHLVLRLFLWRSKLIPWNYPRFLDYAAEHILLRKVGGGYMWSDPFLPDHTVNQQLTP